jgi:NAD(P)-dependent dehydrogenase (short-subunit alcohol dehydrogenase family)
VIARTHAALDQLHFQYGSSRVEVLAGDLAADEALAARAVHLAVERWGRLDALVVNHGSLEPVKKVADASVAEWRAAFEGGVFSVVGLVSFCDFGYFLWHRFIAHFFLYQNLFRFSLSVIRAGLLVPWWLAVEWSRIAVHLLLIFHSFMLKGSLLSPSPILILPSAS